MCVGGGWIHPQEEVFWWPAFRYSRPLETAKRNNTNAVNNTPTRIFHIGFSNTILDVPLANLDRTATAGRISPSPSLTTWNLKKCISSWIEEYKHQCLHQDVRSTSKVKASISSAHRNFYCPVGILIHITRVTLEETFGQEGQYRLKWKPRAKEMGKSLALKARGPGSLTPQPPYTHLGMCLSPQPWETKTGGF